MGNKMNKSKFKKGDRVKYTSGRFSDSLSNPLYGGQYGKVLGSIALISCDVNVLWDNGFTNSYSGSDLKLAETRKYNNHPLTSIFR